MKNMEKKKNKEHKIDQKPPRGRVLEPKSTAGGPWRGSQELGQVLGRGADGPWHLLLGLVAAQLAAGHRVAHAGRRRGREVGRRADDLLRLAAAGRGDLGGSIRVTSSTRPSLGVLGLRSYTIAEDSSERS